MITPIPRIEEIMRQSLVFKLYLLLGYEYIEIAPSFVFPFLDTSVKIDPLKQGLPQRLPEVM